MILMGYFRSSAAFRVRIALNLKGIAAEQRSLHLLRKEHRADDYLRINPQGLVPFLVDEDDAGSFGIGQSLAIIEYLEERFPDPPLLPKSARERAWVRSIAQIIACDIHPLNNLRVLKTLTRDFSITDEQKATWYCHWIREGFSAIEAMLAARAQPGPFCLGEFPTLADICLIPQVANAARFDCSLEPFPLIRAINERALQHPAFVAALPANQPDAE